MKTIGIIGGLGPEATTDYYKEIIKKFNELNPDGSLSYPEIIIYSVSMAKFLGYMEKSDYKSAATYLSNCIQKLKGAGADFAAISANTPHQLFNEIQSQCGLPLISIVESAKDEAKKLNCKKMGLIGTKFTMKASFYPEIFKSAGIEIVVPSASDIEIINEKLFSELELGIIKDDTRAIILGIIAKMETQQKIDSLILGCTEFPLMFTHSEYLEIPFLNTTRIHVAKIVETCLAK